MIILEFSWYFCFVLLLNTREYCLRAGSYPRHDCISGVTFLFFPCWIFEIIKSSQRTELFVKLSKVEARK